MPPKKDGKGKGGGNPLGGGAEPQPPGQQAEEELPPEGPNPFAPAAAEPADCKVTPYRLEKLGLLLHTSETRSLPRVATKR